MRRVRLTDRDVADFGSQGVTASRSATTHRALTRHPSVWGDAPGSAPVQDRDAVVQRALDLGARREQSDAETFWAVLLDPDGNRFCVLQSVEAYAAWRRDTDQPFTTST